MLTLLPDIQEGVNNRPLTYRSLSDSSLDIISRNYFSRTKINLGKIKNTQNKSWKIKVNDIVLVRNLVKPRLYWILGRVSTSYSDYDNK